MKESYRFLLFSFDHQQLQKEKQYRETVNIMIQYVTFYEML